jgi:hypothetical protein
MSTTRNLKLSQTMVAGLVHYAYEAMGRDDWRVPYPATSTRVALVTRELITPGMTHEINDAGRAALLAALDNDALDTPNVPELREYLATPVTVPPLPVNTTGPRSPIRVSPPRQPGNGTTRNWTRTLSGKLYAFFLVTMPDGEIRYEIRRYDGSPEGAKFDCDWTRLHFITIPAPTAPVASTSADPVRTSLVSRGLVPPTLVASLDDFGPAPVTVAKVATPVAQRPVTEPKVSTLDLLERIDRVARNLIENARAQTVDGTPMDIRNLAHRIDGLWQTATALVQRLGRVVLPFPELIASIHPGKKAVKRRDPVDAAALMAQLTVIRTVGDVVSDWLTPEQGYSPDPTAPLMDCPECGRPGIVHRDGCANGQDALRARIAKALGDRECEANARKGTGTGSCDRPLDAHGNCDRASAHITDGA